jgi:hypothetical protein
MGSERRYWYEEGLDPVELEFQRLYGPVHEAKAFFGGFGLDQWVAGGWSIEAFTRGVPAARGPGGVVLAWSGTAWPSGSGTY